MEPTKDLADNIYRERVLRARATPIDQKFLAGADLFEYACRLTCDGIRHQNLGIDEAQVQQTLRERIALARHLERRSCSGAPDGAESYSLAASAPGPESDRIRIARAPGWGRHQRHPALTRRAVRCRCIRG